MRDPKRIPRVLDLLECLWEQYPDLRLGQLLYVLDRFPTHPFYLEDDQLERAITRTIEVGLPGMTPVTPLGLHPLELTADEAVHLEALLATPPAGPPIPVHRTPRADASMLR